MADVPPVFSNREDLSRFLQACSVQGRSAGLMDTSGLNRLVEFSPSDMTVTVETGMKLGALQSLLRGSRQFLPVDPLDDGSLTLRDVIDRDLFGPHRLGWGRLRDWVLGMTVVLGDGTISRSGGRVVKNVAGFDVQKLFIGSHGSLGIPVEVTFKLAPIPEDEVCLECDLATMRDLGPMLARLQETSAPPVAVEVDNLQARPRIQAAYAGAREDVQQQAAYATGAGFKRCEPRRAEAALVTRQPAGPVHRHSMLASSILPFLEQNAGNPFVAFPGLGIALMKGGLPPAPSSKPRQLVERLKQAFDPKGVLPPI